MADLTGLREKLAAQPIGLIDDENLPGTQRFYVHDPWGNRLEFVEDSI